VLNFGGQVMKNVAGYDVSRLLAGSLGTLGLLLECRSRCCRARERSHAALRDERGRRDPHRLNEWGGQPLPLSASCWHDGVLALRLSGARAAVDAARRTLGGELMPDCAASGPACASSACDFFAGDGAAVAPVAAVDRGAIVLAAIS
jgi:glycolate oxidase FAD binding subunit